MLNRLLSHDLPRSRWLALALVLIVARPRVRAVPVPRQQGARRRGQDAGLHPAGRELRPAARLHRHRQLRAHDVLRHRRLRRGDREHAAGRRASARSLLGVAAALAISLVLSLVIGLFSLRVKAIFYAMITLAVAAAFQTLASQLSDFTGGEDGLTFRNPAWLSPSLRAVREPAASASRSTAASSPTTCCSSWRRLLFLAAAAHRQLAVRPRAAGDPRERLPRRGHRLPHGGVPHAEQRAVGAVRHAGRRAAGAVAALHRARHHARASRSCSTSC